MEDYNFTTTQIAEFAEGVGAIRTSVIDVSSIPFAPELLDLCRLNTCGNYGKNYTCPPLVGDIHDLMDAARRHTKAVVFQKVYRLEDSFDIEGMTAANDEFRELTQKIHEFTLEINSGALMLSAGGCKICKPCGAVGGIPCKYPSKALVSLEAYGIHVSKLAEVCGMKYINGVNTCTYFGAVLI